MSGTVEQPIVPVDQTGAPAPVDVAPAAPEEHVPERVPTLLETAKAPGDTAPAPVEAKPTDAAVVDPAAPPVETKTPDPAAPEPASEPIVYPEWKLPEGIAPDKELLGQYTEVLQQHGISPEVGQALLDQHVASINKSRQEYADQVTRDQWRVFGETCREWEKQAMADPVIGGAGFQTSLHAIARVRDATISDAKPGTAQYEKDVAEYNDFLNTTGAGSHPAHLKQLHRMARYMDEPRLPPPNAGPVANGGAPKRKGFDYGRTGASNGA